MRHAQRHGDDRPINDAAPSSHGAGVNARSSHADYSRTDWKRVTAKRPCNLCGRTKYCCFTNDSAVLCTKITEAPAGWRVVCPVPSADGTVFRPDDLPPATPAARRTPKPPKTGGAAARPEARQCVDDGPPVHYTYTDEQGELLFEVVRQPVVEHLANGDRQPGKRFFQRRPERNGNWVNKLGNVRRVLYRLPELIAAPVDHEVFIVEGEKDADRLRSLGLVATTNPQGAGKWRHIDPACLDCLRGRRIVVIPDNDPAGREHAEEVAQSMNGLAESVRVLELPRLREKGDVSDWLDAGETSEELKRLAAAAVAWTPPSEDPVPPPMAWEPFPRQALPPVLERFVSEYALAIGCDPAFMAVPMLAILAGCIGGTRRVVVKQTWHEPAVLWCVVVAPSGTHKTPAFEAAMERIRARQDQEFSTHVERRAQYERDRLAYESNIISRPRSGNADSPEPPPAPKEPTPVRFMVSDTTVEALVPILQENPRGVILARDELAGWFGSFNQYKQGRGGDVGQWLEMHRAGSVICDRKQNRQTLHARRAAVSVVGTIQPGTLNRHLGDEHFESGLAARLLMARPPSRRKQWTEAEVSPEVKAEFDAVIDGLLALDYRFDQYGNPVPIDLPMTPTAKQTWVEFYTEHAGVQERASADDLRAAYSKLEGGCARLALILHLVRRVWRDQSLEDPDHIDDRSMAAAVQITRWFVHETERLYASLRGDERERLDAELTEWVRSRGGEASARDLQTAFRKRYTTAADAHAALDELAKSAVGEWVTLRTGGAPRHVLRLLRNTEHKGDGGSPPSVFCGSVGPAADGLLPNPVDVEPSSRPDWFEHGA